MATTAASRDRTGWRSERFRRTWIDPRSPRSFPLWFGLAAPVVAWATNLVLGDLIFELGCSAGVRPIGGRREILGLPLETWAVIETAAFAVVVVAAGFAALWAWRQVRGDRGIAVTRARAMALGGMASSLYYLLFLAFAYLSTFWLHTCQTSL
jgi:hypothetical protein